MILVLELLLFLVKLLLLLDLVVIYVLPLFFDPHQLEYQCFLYADSPKLLEDYNLKNEYAYEFVSDGISELTKVYACTTIFYLEEKLMIQRYIKNHALNNKSVCID